MEKFFGSILAAAEVSAAYLGDRLGWYEALAHHGPCTAEELARATASDDRYAQEWLEHQTVAGYLKVIDASAPPEQRRFELPAAHAEVLTDRESLSYIMPLARLVAGLGKSLDELTNAYRTGTGVPWSHHGPDGRESQGDANRPMFLHQLGPEYLASIPEVADALSAGARVAEVGAGMGWAAIGIASTWPQVTVDTFDLDEPSVLAARANIAEAGLADRVTAHHADASAGAVASDYELVLALECIHDLPDPVSVLATMREMAGAEGTVIVMDERVGEVFTGEPDPIEQIMYSYSLLCCLPDGRSVEPTRATGTVMRRPTLERYATEAGFSAVEVLPIMNDFFTFYRLRT